MTDRTKQERRETLIEAALDVAQAFGGRERSARGQGASCDGADPVAHAIARCRAGDRDAFRVLVETHERMVTSLVSRMVPQREEAEDLVQEVFLQAYRSLGSFRGQSSFSTWLYRIAVNKTLRRLSQLRKRSAASLEEMAELNLVPTIPEESPLHRLCSAEEQDRIRRAVLGLPDKHRLVVTMHYFEEYSCQEIAEILGCSVGTVWSRLHYALKKLKGDLECVSAG